MDDVNQQNATAGEDSVLTRSDGGASDVDAAWPKLPPAAPESSLPALHYLASLHNLDSRKTMANALRAVARAFGRKPEDMPWAALRSSHTRALAAVLARRYAPATANLALTALREVLRSARRLRQLSADDLADALDFKGIRGSREPPGKALTLEELVKLFTAARTVKKRRRGAREAAVVALLFGAGLRRAEVVKVGIQAFEGDRLRVLGKGNKEREIFLPEGAQRAIADWVELRGRDPGPLITHLDSLKPLSADSLEEILQRLAKRAGVGRFSSHDGRRTMATSLDEAGAAAADIQLALGHASVVITERYLRRRRLAERKKRTAKLLTVPY